MPRHNPRDPENFYSPTPIPARDRRDDTGLAIQHHELPDEETRHIGIRIAIQAKMKNWDRCHAIINALEYGNELIEPTEKDLLATPLSQILDEPRIVNVLEKCEIRTLGDLCAADNEMLVSIPGVGPKSVQSLRHAQERALAKS